MRNEWQIPRQKNNGLWLLLPSNLISLLDGSRNSRIDKRDYLSALVECFAYPDATQHEAAFRNSFSGNAHVRVDSNGKS
jgi:hypothetical protein